MSSNTGIKKIFTKLENCVNNGNYYEAHQMYRTIYFRYLGQKKYEDLIQLLYEGSKLLLKKQQFTSGADLGILLIDVLIKSNTEPSEIYFDKLSELFHLMTPLMPERDTFRQNAMNWSSLLSSHKTGHPELHRKFAKLYWQEKNYVLARHHYLHTNDGSGCAEMLLDFHQNQGYSNEVDLFITQTVLQYLCLKNKETAKILFKAYTEQHPQINKNQPPYTYPLLNFVFFLLETIESGKQPVFTILCQTYSPSLNRDPTYLQYLNKIGQLFFNIQTNRQRSSGIFSSLIQSFFGNMDSENSEQDLQMFDSSFTTADID